MSHIREKCGNEDGDSTRASFSGRGSRASVLPPRGPVATIPKPDFMSKRSPVYLFCAGSLAFIALYLGGYQFTLLGYQYYDQVKLNLKEPWIPFCWMGSKGVDVTDMQWYYFVIALPPTLPILLLFVALSQRLKRQAAPVVMPYSPAAAAAAAAAEHAKREGSKNRGPLFTVKDPTAFPPPVTSVEVESGNYKYLYFGRNITSVLFVHLAFGVLIAALISGPGCLFGLGLILANYYILAPMQKRFSFRACMAVMWVSHIVILFINHHADGYRFSWFGLSFLDSLYNPLIRWSVQYNMSVLRMIAFNSDFWEARMHGEERREKAWSKHDRCCVQCAVIRDENRHISPTGRQAESLRCYKCRTECPRPLEEYNVLAYLAYMFYPPLFIAGPMSSFNGYVSHLHYPTRAVVGKAVARYGLRFLINAVFLSAMMHYVWVNALLFTKPPSNDADPSATDLVGVGKTRSTAAPRLSVFEQLDYASKVKLLCLMLAFLWSKFNVIWKFFRFLSLLDGFDPPEDMHRCFANTVNIQGFWRDWHASFNLWIVRYMYIPMGGRQKIKYSIFPIFFFIAIWHDIELRLLFWALFMSVFMVPEVAITTLFASKSPTVVKIRRNVTLYRHLRALATCFNMILLIVVNLIGFSIGMSGAQNQIETLLKEMSWKFVALSFYILFLSAQVAIQVRDQEAYQQQVLVLKYDLQSR